MLLSRLGRLAALAAASTLVGCLAYGHFERDRDHAPHRDTGVGASVIMPGQSPPPVSDPTQQSWQSGPAGARGQSAGGPGDPAPAGSEVVARPRITTIGGSDEQVETHQAAREAPIWNKYLIAPFAVLAYPFVKAKEAVQGEPEPGPPVPPKNEATTMHPAEVQRANEQARMRALEDQRSRAMERELEQRQGGPGGAAGGTVPYSGGGTVPYRYENPPETAPTGRPPLSIAEELEALRGRRGQAPSPPAVAPRQPEVPAPAPVPAPVAPVQQRPVWPQASPPVPAPPLPQAPAPQPLSARMPAPGGPEPARSARRWDQVVDRNGDGAPDEWIDRHAAQGTQQAFDDDGDGVPERIVTSDPQTGAVVEVDEDTDRDGRIDSWSVYRDGQMVEQRSDTNHDGRPDTWGTYRANELVRLEADTNGDGFRDRVRYYRNGHLLRETQDADGDGYPEATLYYDEHEQLERRDEDLDGDGRVDVTSHYEGGRLRSRELLNAVAQHPESALATPDDAGTGTP